MPYLHRVTRVTLSGLFLGGLEEWSTGFYMGNETADADLPTQQLADDIRNAFQTFFTAPTSEISSAWNFDTVKVSSVGTDGKSNAADTVFSTVTALKQGAQSNVYPPQISLVATMTSPLARGVGSKGRMYLPGVAKPFGMDGKIPGANVSAIATNLKTFFTAVNASSATNNVVVLASQGSLNADGTPKVGGSAPITKAVTGLKVGNVYDTQRRRRNGLQENYTTLAGPF